MRISDWSSDVCSSDLYAPGGATDILARMVGKQLSENLGQPVVIENKAGGNTSIAATQVARAEADGYTLLFTNDATFVLNPALFKSLNYDIDKEFKPVGDRKSTRLNSSH